MNTLFEQQWDQCWDNVENQPWYPDEQVVRFLARYVARRMGFSKKEVKYNEALSQKPRGLDLGCGKGRHVVLMSEMDIQSYGCDISQSGLQFSKNWLDSKNLEAELKQASIDKLPYEDGFFDFVICHGVLDHCLDKPRKDSVKEVLRVLKPGGYYFFSVISEHDSAFGQGKKVEEDTWIIEEGFEKNIPQAFFTLDRIDKEFRDFEVVSVVECDSRTLKGRSLIGTDKHYAVDARYYVTARKP